MNKMLAVFASVTTAGRVKRALGGDAKVIQTPASLGIKSCSYSLIFNEDRLLDVEALVKKQGVRIKALFVISADGSYVKY